MSVHTSLSFLKIGSLVVSDIVDGDSWPYYLATDEGRILKKKKKKKNAAGGVSNFSLPGGDDKNMGRALAGVNE